MSTALRYGEGASYATSPAVRALPSFHDLIMSNTNSSETTKRPWSAPQLVELPKLTELTLATGSGIPGGGDTSGGGSTVIP